MAVKLAFSNVESIKIVFKYVNGIFSNMFQYDTSGRLKRNERWVEENLFRRFLSNPMRHDENLELTTGI